MVKDLLKSLNSIHNDNNLSLEEKFLLTILIKYHNYKLNYAYPSYEVLMVECSTNRKAKISKIVKALSEKEYITIKKSHGNKSLYFINKHLHYIEKIELTNSNNQKQSNNPQKVGIDSNGNTPLDGEITDEEAIKQAEKAQEATDVEKVVKATGCSVQEADKALEYAITCNKTNPVGFSISAIKNGWEFKNKDTAGINPRSFNNFKSREYDYDSLEKKLLGWDDTEPEEVEEIPESTGYDFLKKYGIGSSISN